MTSTSNGAPATHTGRPAQHSGARTETSDLINCEFCGSAHPRGRMVDHIQGDHPDRLFKHNGVTTQTLPCPDVKWHARHKWQPGNGTEFFTCPGSETVETPQAPGPGFHAWWAELVDAAAPTIQRKAGEYGSNSLAEMGRMFARAQGRDRIEDHEALEIGCMIYAKGKLERVLDAMLKGRLPSLDTWHDLGVYASMAQYIRENQRWP